MKIITRAEARKLGLKRYFLGPDKPCKNGHIAEKLVSNRTCVLCYEAGRKRRVQRVGAMTYHGRPCKRCGGTLRQTANGSCAACALARVNAAYAADPEAGREKNRAAYARNPEPRKEQRRDYARRNRTKETAASRAWSAKNPEKVKAQNVRRAAKQRERRASEPEHSAKRNAEYADWAKRNPEKARAKARRSYARRSKTLEFRIQCAIRNAVGHALRSGKKFTKSLETIGCTMEELIAFIERQFRDGMEWGNWGKLTAPGGWELDHRKAVGLHDLSNRAEFLAAFHYSNLQPLLIHEHRQKSKVDHALVRDLRRRNSSSAK